MKIINRLPPHYSEIKAVLNPPKDAIFCYGDTIYNPSGGIVWPDLEFHEHCHEIQQGDNPDKWWMLYLSNSVFRQQEEIQAYSAQYTFLKEKIKMTNKDLKQALFEMAQVLSGDYKLDLTYQEAENLIRNYERPQK